MKRKFTVMATAIVLSSSILFSSCIGSFTLFHKVLSWNKSVGDKWVNELVFLVLCAVPVYEIAWAIDALVLNSIEFWTGSNPASSDVQTKKIETENGTFTITTDANGHKIQKEGSDEIVEFRFNQEENSWSVEAMGQTTPLLKFMDNNQAEVYLADGSTMTVSMDQAGAFALKQVIEGKAYFANK
ncbi:membrane protein [Bacteroidia bacterium]|nr:membrane protein [Bacteroidia bacterium]